jgi:hypothetical protein
VKTVEIEVVVSVAVRETVAVTSLVGVTIAHATGVVTVAVEVVPATVAVDFSYDQ